MNRVFLLTLLTPPLLNNVHPAQTVMELRFLDVGRVRELGLDVLPDSPSHVNIIGLPYREDDPATAERLARLLAKQSRIVWQP